jgi:hypothetical protein
LAFGQDAPQVEEIASLVAQIKAQPNARVQWDLGMALADIVETSPNSAKIGDDTILEIASLLNNRNVQVSAASALGDLGPRAAIAVPQLETAFRQAEAEEKLMIVGPDFSAADVIRGVLSKITGTPYEAIH